LAEARRRLAAAVRPTERIEVVPLEDSSGRVAAEDVTSRIDVPPFARSAMDGYAVVAADTARASPSSPAVLRLVDRVYTGSVPLTRLESGRCAEIATGAVLPSGADAVVMVEDTLTIDEHRVAVSTPVDAGQNVGPRGADIALGSLVVRSGDLLSAGRVGALAAVGVDRVSVYQKPRVAILSTGNEVVEPGRDLAAGQIYDVNRYTIGAVVAAHGGSAEFHEPVQDTLDSLHRAFDRSAGADIIVFSGGSSVGERDLIVDVVGARGQVIFHGIAVKPGKPTVFGLVGGAAFFGMPGNPTSCLSNAYVLLVPFLRGTARLPPYVPRTVSAPLARTIRSAPGRHQFYTVRLEAGSVVPAFKGSGDITSLSRADGYIEIPAGIETLNEGALVDVTLF
jgi:molybdenum cofactor synthesis domain-containing protein